jgi:hypothetical protein
MLDVRLARTPFLAFVRPGGELVRLVHDAQIGLGQVAAHPLHQVVDGRQPELGRLLEFSGDDGHGSFSAARGR